MKIKGYLLAAFAAAAYGTNPAFAIPLYEQGMNPNTVLLFRYLLGLPLLAVLLKSRGHSLSLPWQTFGQVLILGILMALSSLTLFDSFNYLNSGIASTLLFIYPILTAILMVFFFHERMKPTILVCLVLMCCGMFLLMRTEGGGTLSPYGCLLVMVSALTYALYLVMVNVSHSISAIPTSKLLFYVLGVGALMFGVLSLAGTPFTMPRHAASWVNIAALAIIPTLLSLACTTKAIKLIGSTSTAILGALEPVTAVILSVAVLGQPITPREICGSILILVATTLVVASSNVERLILHVRKMFPRRK
ncbi:MAG: DMT family transporter [Muribaculaceae bacterium]|nr:DMT family transporter [Muribaculaceae bacterium]